MNNYCTITKSVFALLFSLVVGAASAADVLKYGATFEAEANGVTNDFAYVVGDYIAEADYHGVADGEPYGWLVSYYSYSFNGVNYSYSDDESQIIARTDAAGGQALQLNTDAGTLTNKLQQSVADEITAAIADGGGAYIETDIMFVPSDTLDAGIPGGYGSNRATKSLMAARVYVIHGRETSFVSQSSTSPLFAIYAYADEEGWSTPDSSCVTNLVIFHGVMDANGGITYTNEIFSSAPIDASRYTKLRIEMRQLEDPLNPGAKYNAFSVKVDDGAALSSATALDARFGGTSTGTWFMTVEDRGLHANHLLSQLNFKGTGMIDNIKVGVMEGVAPSPYNPGGGESGSGTGNPPPLSGLDYNRCHDGMIGENSVWVVGPSAQGQLETPAEQIDPAYGWKYEEGSHSNLIARTPNGSQWKASGVGLAISTRNLGSPGVDTTLGMDYPTLYFQNLPPSEIPYIRSPKLEGGVGTIDFRSRLISENNTMKTSELTLQVAYTDEEPTETDWIDIAFYRYGSQNGNVFSSINHVVLNDYSITYVRIVRTGYNIYNPAITPGRLAVDNICITKPAADVGVIEKLRNPGYPAADQSIRMRCAVTNCVETTPATNRHVSVKYQYVARDSDLPIAGAAWSSAEMVYKGKDENGLDWYEGTIPKQRIGYVWYFYQVDYDGYNYGVNPLTGVSESLSPAYWDAGTDTHVRPAEGARLQIRPYRSRYGHVSLVAEPAKASVAEMTLVGDEQWQTVIGVDGINAVSSTFVGFGYYEDDASAYDDTPVVWGENDQGKISVPPFTGFLESSHDTTVTNSLVVRNEENYAGFYMYRFHSNDKDEVAAQNDEGDRRYDYIVKKAVYQDFDDWTASPVYYESSLGGLQTLTYAEDFDGNGVSVLSDAICTTNAWTQDGYDPDNDIKREDFQEDALLSDVFSDDDVKTHHGFIRTGSRILADRRAKNTEPRVNQTMALQPHGKIQNTGDAMSDGLEKVAFHARVSVNDRNFAIYKSGTDWNETNGKFPQYISATWQLVEMSPDKPYFSYIFLYQPPLWDGASWYELRIIQTDSANANNDTVNVELWRHSSDGVEARIGTRNNLTGFNLRSSRTVNVLVDKNGAKLRVRVHLAGGNPATIANNTTARSAYLQDSSPINLATGGTIGFGVFDAVPFITAVKVGTTNGGTDLLPSLGSTFADWYAGGKRSDGQPRWTITSGAITRTVPTQTIGFYATDCEGNANRADSFPSTPVATRTVSSLYMADFSVDFKAWNKKFVQIRHEDGEGFVVLDNVEFHPWRAKTRSDVADAETVDGVSSRDWTSIDQQNEWLDRTLNPGDSMSNHWAVLEGWVANSGPFRIGANFERSRANTNLVQGVVSPYLANGLGSISFTYDVSGGKVVYGVERTNENDGHAWTPVAVFMNAAGDSGERYVKIGEYFGGRIRVRIYGAQDVDNLLTKNQDCGYDYAWGYTDNGAKLHVDNLRAKDYPEDVNDTAWRAYNLLVTDNAPDGHIYTDSGKSCFFNNSPTDGVYGVEEFNDDDPYLESPPLRGVGIGEIAFQYRLVPGTANAGTDGHLVIKAAPSRDTPLAEWTTITNLVVSAAGTAFVKFADENILSETNFVVRFYNSKEPGTPRIVIDNVLVAAPTLGGNATLSFCDPEGNAIADEDVLDWIKRHGADQTDIDALTMDEFNTDFLLNLDITKECVAELKISSIQIEDGIVYLTAQLTRKEDGTAVGTRTINGTLKLLGKTNLVDDEFTTLDAGVGNGDFGNGNTSGLEYELPDSNPPAFFKVIVE